MKRNSITLPISSLQAKFDEANAEKRKELSEAYLKVFLGYLKSFLGCSS